MGNLNRRLDDLERWAGDPDRDRIIVNWDQDPPETGPDVIVVKWPNGCDKRRRRAVGVRLPGNIARDDIQEAERWAKDGFL